MKTAFLLFLFHFILLHFISFIRGPCCVVRQFRPSSSPLVCFPICPFAAFVKDFSRGICLQLLFFLSAVAWTGGAAEDGRGSILRGQAPGGQGRPETKKPGIGRKTSGSQKIRSSDVARKRRWRVRDVRSKFIQETFISIYTELHKAFHLL